MPKIYLPGVTRKEKKRRERREAFQKVKCCPDRACQCSKCLAICEGQIPMDDKLSRYPEENPFSSMERSIVEP
jgi:hypothetical protein